MTFFSDLISGTLAVDPAAAAIEFEHQWYSWGDLSRAMAALAQCLAQAGIGSASRIGVMMRNRPSAIAGIFQVIAGNSCLVSINPLLPDERLAADLAKLQLPVVIAEMDDLSRPGVLDALRQAGSAVIAISADLAEVRPVSGLEEPTGADLRHDNPGVVIEMLTSGTTGAPKRVPLRYDSFEQSFRDAMAYEKDRKPHDPPRLRDGVQVLTNPLSHIGGLWGMLSALLAGRQICLVEKFTVEGWRDAVVRHRPAVVGGVPAVLRMILDANIPKEDLASVKAIRTGAAPLDPTIVQEFMVRYGLPVLQNYGATEFAGAIAGWTLKDFFHYWDMKVGSVGRLHPGVEARIIEPETGEILPSDQEGILEIRAAQLGNGGQWLRTTDRALIDEQGFLFIKGRADNAIIRGGFKVHPDDVVAVLEQHPAVREAVVVGVADARLGAVPVAAIILKAGATPVSDAELARFARERLLPYQVPVRFRFVEDVPRTPSLKPALPQVRDLFASEAG